MQTRHYIVTIHDTEHVVRSTSRLAAKRDALADRVSSRVATSDEIVAAARAGTRIIGEPDAAPAMDPDREAAIDAAVDEFCKP